MNDWQPVVPPPGRYGQRPLTPAMIAAFLENSALPLTLYLETATEIRLGLVTALQMNEQGGLDGRVRLNDAGVALTDTDWWLAPAYQLERRDAAGAVISGVRLLSISLTKRPLDRTRQPKYQPPEQAQ